MNNTETAADKPGGSFLQLTISVIFDKIGNPFADLIQLQQKLAGGHSQHPEANR